MGVAVADGRQPVSATLDMGDQGVVPLGEVTSSSGVYGPFQTSTASASLSPNFQLQPMQVACGCAGMTRPPARWMARAYFPKALSRAR